MRSASSLNFSPIYFSTCSRETTAFFTLFLIGRPVSLLAKRRISSTERKSSLASTAVILCSFSTGSISRRVEGVREGSGSLVSEPSFDCGGSGGFCGESAGGGEGGVGDGCAGVDCCVLDGLTCADERSPQNSSNTRCAFFIESDLPDSFIQ